MKTDPQNGKAGIQAALPPSPSACQVLSVPSHQHTSIRTTNVQHNSFLADLSTYGSIFTYSSVFPWSDGKAIKLAALTRPFEEAVSALRSVEDTVICSTHEPNPWQQDDKSILSHHPEAFFTLREWTDSQFVKDEYLYDLSGDPGAVYIAKIVADKIEALEESQSSLHLASKRYLCTVCLNARCYRNRDEWRRHEKEHERIYKCKLGGLEQFSTAPDIASTAGELSLCSSSCKRRSDMVAHLKKHGLSDTAKAQELADKFLDSSGKRFWSCGFCVQVFGSFDERLNHLHDHFEKYPTVDQWRLSNEVQGLLQQPGVTQAWDQLLGARYGRDRPQTFWPRSALVAQLNFDLQMGISDTQSAQDLAEAAYTASNLGQDLSSPKLGSLVPYGSFGTSRESQPQVLTLPTVTHQLSDSHEGATSDENTNTREPFTNGMVDQMNDDDFYSFIDPRLISDPNPSLSDFPEW